MFTVTKEFLKNYTNLNFFMVTASVLKVANLYTLKPLSAYRILNIRWVVVAYMEDIGLGPHCTNSE